MTPIGWSGDLLSSAGRYPRPRSALLPMLHLVQSVDGYDMTICSGVPIFEKGEETGARPGKLVRSAA